MKSADTFNSYFNGVVNELKILINEDLLESVIDRDYPILSATEKYNSHLSIIKIKEKANVQNHFCLKHVTSKEL